MCGIVGYVGKDNAVDVILNGLKRLEYRGYDSAGIALIDNDKLVVKKCKGKVNALEKVLKDVETKPHNAIGHTRWATHGKPCDQNSHPHTDCKGELAIVHNGIIENFLDLKTLLLGKGHTFASETDSETVIHLIEQSLEDLKKKFPDKKMRLLHAVQDAQKIIHGSFAFALNWSQCPDIILAVRKQSPLVIGIGKNGNYLGSDIPAFLDGTRDVVYLEDNETALISKDEVEIYALNGKKIKYKIHNVKWDLAMAEKDGYDHFMMKEIHEQPKAVENTLAGKLTFNERTFKAEFGLDYEFVKQLKQLNIAACGTAYHAGMIAKYAIEHFAKIPVYVDIASEFRYRDGIPLSSDGLLLAISQSGETADTLAVIRNINKKCKKIAVCNVVGSSLTRECDHTVYTRCGPEIGVASTKAFTGQLAAIFALSLHLGVARKTLTVKKAKELASQLLQIPSQIKEILSDEETTKKIAIELADNWRFLFLGRDINYPIALEGALKLKEISYVHAEAFAGGEMKHGPIAIIDEGTIVFGVVPSGRLQEKMHSNLAEAAARGAHVVGIVPKGEKLKPQEGGEFIYVPKTYDYFAPLLTVIPFQLFAYYVAFSRGCEIDQPRNLAKSVTVE